MASIRVPAAADSATSAASVPAGMARGLGGVVHTMTRAKRHQRRDDAADVLVGHDADHERDAGPALVLEVGRERARAVGIVGGVEDDLGAAPPHALQPAGPPGTLEPGPHRCEGQLEAGSAESLHQAEGDGGILDLVPPGQRGQHADELRPAGSQEHRPHAAVEYQRRVNRLRGAYEPRAPAVSLRRDDCERRLGQTDRRPR